MKKITLLLASIVLFSCNKEKKDYVSISGTVANSKEKTITIQNDSYSKKITIAEDGTFKDTLHLKGIDKKASYEESLFAVTLGRARTFSFLQNGFELELKIDGNDFIFSGDGSENSNYIKEKIKLSREFMNIQAYLSMDNEGFNKKLADAKIAFDGTLEKYKNDINKEFSIAEKNSNQEFYKVLKETYERQKSAAITLAKGKPSPQFSDYENFKGGNSSLADYKGKYIYIDVWATWCGPCKQQIPYLKTLEEKYHNKNIEFVSISIDQPKLKETWKKMITNKNMGGIQLFADGDQSFSRAYQITGIPRFILIDPKGNIVDANAPRPSDPSLTTLFKELGI